MSEETVQLPSNMFARTLSEVSHGDLAEQASEQLAELAFDEVVKSLTASLRAKNKSLPPVIRGSIRTLPRPLIESHIYTA